MVIDTVQADLLAEVSAIEPFDAVEAAHQQHTLRWIRSGAPLYRIAKPDVPSQHLVAYFVVYDPRAYRLLLVDHLKAKAWLPTGGHVLVDEHPRDAVVREADEELGMLARSVRGVGEAPFFVTVTRTRGEGVHTDVSVWYVIEGDVNVRYASDGSEFSYYKWVSLEQVQHMDPAGLDPHMHRFARKLQAALQIPPYL
jgi:8-oxo-dGTP pyrophosphatase MutT (NUDIX family)